MHAEQALSKMGIRLEPVSRSGKSVLKLRRYKNLLFVSGHAPAGKNGESFAFGRAGADITEEQAYEAAKMCAVNMLATLKDYLGDLDRIEEWVKVLGLVNSGGDFARMPKVINGFSDVIVSAFGARGRHARSAMGSFNHESGFSVVVDAVIKIRDDL